MCDLHHRRTARLATGMVRTAAAADSGLGPLTRAPESHPTLPPAPPRKTQPPALVVFPWPGIQKPASPRPRARCRLGEPRRPRHVSNSDQRWGQHATQRADRVGRVRYRRRRTAATMARPRPSRTHPAAAAAAAAAAHAPSQLLTAAAVVKAGSSGRVSA